MKIRPRRGESLKDFLVRAAITIAIVLTIFLLGRFALMYFVESRMNKLQEGVGKIVQRQQNEANAKLEAARQRDAEREETEDRIRQEIRQQSVEEKEIRRVELPKVEPQKTAVAIYSDRPTPNPEKTWESWFKPLPGCEEIGEANMMACTNHQIRERERFERLIAEGKLKQ